MKSSDIILGILLDGPATGYSIKEKFSTSFSFFYNASFGSIYPILRKLTDEEKVIFETVPQDGKPDKKVYSITEKGKEAFDKYLEQPVEEEKIKWEFMARLFNSKYLTADERIKLINSEIEAKESEIQSLTNLQEGLVGKEVDQYRLLCLKLGIKQKQVVVDELKLFKEKNLK